MRALVVLPSPSAALFIVRGVSLIWEWRADATPARVTVDHFVPSDNVDEENDTHTPSQNRHVSQKVNHRPHWDLAIHPKPTVPIVVNHFHDFLVSDPREQVLQARSLLLPSSPPFFFHPTTLLAYAFLQGSSIHCERSAERELTSASICPGPSSRSLA